MWAAPRGGAQLQTPTARADDARLRQAVVVQPDDEVRELNRLLEGPDGMFAGSLGREIPAGVVRPKTLASGIGLTLQECAVEVRDEQREGSAIVGRHRANRAIRAGLHVVVQV